eukprot:316260_1
MIYACKKLWIRKFFIHMDSNFMLSKIMTTYFHDSYPLIFFSIFVSFSFTFLFKLFYLNGNELVNYYCTHHGVHYIAKKVIVITGSQLKMLYSDQLPFLS